MQARSISKFDRVEVSVSQAKMEDKQKTRIVVAKKHIRKYDKDRMKNREMQLPQESSSKTICGVIVSKC